MVIIELVQVGFLRRTARVEGKQNLIDRPDCIVEMPH